MNIPKAIKKKSGKWQIQLRIGGVSRTVTADTEKECIKEAQVLKARLLANEDISMRKTSKYTLESAFQNYIDSNSKVLSPSTLRSYKLCMANHFKDAMSKPLNANINWQKLINEEAEISSPKTVINNWGMVSRVLRVNDIPVPNINLPMRIKSEHPWLDYEQIKKFLDIIKGEPWELSALLALNGLRRSELAALDISSIDTDKMIIKIKGAVVEGIDGIVKKDTNKNTSSSRDVPIVIPRIAELIKTSDKVMFFKGMDSLRRAINLACLRNGLPEVGVHGLRHSFASLAYHEQIPLEVVQRWGGWSEDKTLKKIYLHLADKDLNNYAEKMRNSL